MLRTIDHVSSVTMPLLSSRFLHRHQIILLFCFSMRNYTKARQSTAELWPKTILKWRPPAILNFKNVRSWSRDCHRVLNLHLCTKFQNRMIFRWDVEISRFSRWRISAILNFWVPIVGSLKSQFMTSYRSTIETIALNCLCFFLQKITFCVRILAIDKRTDGQNQWVKALSLSRAAPCGFWLAVFGWMCNIIFIAPVQVVLFFAWIFTL